LHELEKDCNPTGLQLVATGLPVAVGAQNFFEQLQLLKNCHLSQLVTTGHNWSQPENITHVQYFILFNL
jgi:hypothetical protein